MELLAPAGGSEQLKYAVHYGADAVYLSCDRFGMRRRATNFTLESVPEAVDFARENGVKVYVTLNTMMHDDDLADLPTYASALRDAEVDAFIIGDLGAARLVRELAPEVAIHVSTQASVSNVHAARTWLDLGAKRIVCAREMSLEEIARMKKELGNELELEVFVHGAMCMAYSGRCLISDFMTGRSAQSGHCAQSCRWRYTLEEEKRPGEHYPIEEDENGSYIMNAQDLNMLSHVNTLRDAGIDSIKIEGRNKKAFYVATVVNAYRNVLDGGNPSTFANELEVVSHRPYSTGFFFGPAHQSPFSDLRMQKTEWAAEVVSCHPGDGEGEWIVEARCRNSFDMTTPLEALMPHNASIPIHISDAYWIGGGHLEAIDTINRAMELYRFTCDQQLEPYAIIRMPKEKM